MRAMTVVEVGGTFTCKLKMLALIFSYRHVRGSIYGMSMSDRLRLLKRSFNVEMRTDVPVCLRLVGQDTKRVLVSTSTCFHHRGAMHCLA